MATSCTFVLMFNESGLAAVFIDIKRPNVQNLRPSRIDYPESIIRIGYVAQLVRARHS